MTEISHLLCENITKIYRGGSLDGSADVSALKGVTLEVPHGQFLAIMGASGSGKSTLLHIAAGLTKPTSGTVRINETQISSLGDRALTLFRRENVGVVFQAFNLIPTLTAEENILLPILAGGKSGGTEKMNAAMTQILTRLNLLERRRHYPDALSGGEQQRVAIARALANNPRMIVADEPTGNLDPVRSLELMLLFEKINEMGTTILVVTHEKELVNAFAKRVITIDNGRVISDGMDGYYSYEIE